MTFRETDEAVTSAISPSGAGAQSRVKIRSKLRHDGLPKLKAVAEPIAADMEEEEAGRPVTLEETPALSEEALRPGATSGEDPVRLYLKEIGKVRLLTAEHEVAIGRRIEAGQIQLRRALAGIPMATARLLGLADLIRRQEMALDEVILLPDGVEPKPEEVKPLLAAFARIRRLEREIERLELALADRRRGKTTRANYHKWIAQNRASIQGVGEKLPLKPALVDRRGFKFSTYATWWIRQAITRAIADHSRTIRIPVHMVETLNRIARVNRSMVNDLGREPTPEELAQKTGVPARKVRLILESSRKPLSLETPIGEDSELGDFLEDKSAESPNETLITQDLTTQVERALSTLSPKEKEILRLRFGIGEEGEHTLEEVGRRFSVTRERIRQIETKALRKLRHPLRGRALRAFVEN